MNCVWEWRAIETFKSGGRPIIEKSLFPFGHRPRTAHKHIWFGLACYAGEDLEECLFCGAMRVVECSFSDQVASEQRASK